MRAPTATHNPQKKRLREPCLCCICTFLMKKLIILQLLWVGNKATDGIGSPVG
jgi:hypothetical protein